MNVNGTFKNNALEILNEKVIQEMEHYEPGQIDLKLIAACVFGSENELGLLIHDITCWAKTQIVHGKGYLSDYSRILARFGKNRQARIVAEMISDNDLRFHTLLYNASSGKNKEDFQYLLESLEKICPYRLDDTRRAIAEALAKIGEKEWALRVAAQVENKRSRKTLFPNIEYYTKEILKAEKIKHMSSVSRIKCMYNLETKAKNLDQLVDIAMNMQYGSLILDIIREYLGSEDIRAARKTAQRIKNIHFTEYFRANAFLLVWLKTGDAEDLEKAVEAAYKCDDNFNFKPASLAELAIVTGNPDYFKDACRAMSRMPAFDDEKKLFEYVTRRLNGQMAPCSYEKFRTADIGRWNPLSSFLFKKKWITLPYRVSIWR